MKRKRKFQEDFNSSKRQKPGHDQAESLLLLRQYYPKVTSLRDYLVSHSPKKRRSQLAHVSAENSHDLTKLSDQRIHKLLDDVIVGSFQPQEHVRAQSFTPFEKEITVFSQQLTESSLGAALTQGALRQSEIVDFTIWLLFRQHNTSQKPSHMLCHGYQRSVSQRQNSEELAVTGIPGILSSCTNPYVEAFKSEPWGDLPALLGKGGEQIISEMLMNCGMFKPVCQSTNLNQISGTPLRELKAFSERQAATTVKVPCHSRPAKEAPPLLRRWTDIKIVRYRMLYSRPTLSANDVVRFGLQHVHVLNRFVHTDDPSETVHIMKHIFPRRFGLHNVFTSVVNAKECAQPYKDYTLREEEIARMQLQIRERHPTGDNMILALPKRLRGEALELFSRLRKRHSRCAYARLIQHYCPARTAGLGFVDQATTPAQVSAFCRAAVLRVFPSGCWGVGEAGRHNKTCLLRSVDRFVRLRRYETLSLHELMQDVKITALDWLKPPHSDQTAKLSRTDFMKRQEIFAELVYYVFDSFLIPLVRSNFHVTESGAHRNQLFYFRHDVWKAMSEPALTALKVNMLEQLKPMAMKQLLSKRALGYSSVRLLPKERGMRPIINLRRRVQRIVNGKVVLGKSINGMLTPAFSILNLEKDLRPDRLGSALFSVDDIYPRLRAFRSSLQERSLTGRPLYFAKVDVQSCFDTIPQVQLIEMAKNIFTSARYSVSRYARAKLIDVHNGETSGVPAKPSWKFLTKASAGGQSFDFRKEVEGDTFDGRSKTIFVDGVVQQNETHSAVVSLLKEHVQCNLIMLGKKLYRQKEGIPQGSIVSSLLCSFFYSDLERECLDFIQDGQSILLRLIDDFLVISTEEDVAAHFIRVMHRGLPKYGVKVKAEKSRANFDVVVDGNRVTRVPGVSNFPYCGNAINTVTLDISKDSERRKTNNIRDSITVEHTRHPGQSFHRKTLNALKLQMHAMLLSTSYNAISTVLSNLYHAFTEVAEKSFYYIRSLPAKKQPHDGLVIKAVDDLIRLACVLMKSRKGGKKSPKQYECSVLASQSRWLACAAFRAVFEGRQTKHLRLLAWLQVQQLAAETRCSHEEALLLEGAAAKRDGLNAVRR